VNSVGPIKLFGSCRRTEVLVLIALLGEAYPTEIARLLGAPLYSVQTIVNTLVRDGIVTIRLMGRMRLASLDPDYFAFEELEMLLLRLAEAEPEMREIANRKRSRPRRYRGPI
jgi:DNA-binding transcriptional ArsR family regulator